MGLERNWAGNVVYRAARVHEPASVAEVQAVVAAATRVRAVGTRHSFSAIADTDGDMVSLAALPRQVDIDAATRTVTVDGGITYGELATQLDDHGWALANLASLPHISVAGACATGTHGSGAGNGNLATAVVALQLVLASGDIVDVSRAEQPDVMDAVTVGLGAAGLVTRLTLDIEPAYEVRQHVYERLPMPVAIDQLDQIMADGYSVSLFTTWRSDWVEQLWCKDRVRPDGGRAVGGGHGAIPATRNLHPVAGLTAESCTDQLGVPGPWHERLPHFRMGFTPSSGDELQSELFVDRRDAPDVMRALVGMADTLAPVLKVSEVRSVAADELWMSPCHRRDSIAFHFTWVPSWSQVEPVLRRLEATLQRFAPRPHWGKLTTIDAGIVGSRYERLGAFAELLGAWDPLGTFRNETIDALLR